MLFINQFPNKELLLKPHDPCSFNWYLEKNRMHALIASNYCFHSMYALSFEEGTTLLWQKRDLQGESRPKFQNKTRWFLTIGLSGAERGVLGWSSWKKRSRREGKLENLVKSTSLKVLGLRAPMRKRYRPCSGAWSRRDERGRQGISSEGDSTMPWFP